MLDHVAQTNTEVAAKGTPALEPRGNGVWLAPNARIIDRSSLKRLPIGREGFATAM